MAGLEIPKIGVEREKRGLEQIQETKVELPQRKFFIEAFAKALAAKEITCSAEKGEAILGDILDTYVEENLDRAELFTSAETGAQFPYTRFDTAEFAKRLYEKYKGKKPEIRGEGPQEVRSKEFVFGAFLHTKAGSTFATYEEHLRMLVMRIPRALEALERGEEPEHHEIYGIGSPTNIVGLVTPDFSARAREEGAFETFGTLYSEFVASKLPEPTDREGPNVYFWGSSMGGSLAAKTGEWLLKKGVVTQITREECKKILKDEKVSPEVRRDMETALRLPHLAIRADIAPALNKSYLLRYLKTPAAFHISRVQNRLRSPYIKEWWNKEATFSARVAAALKERHDIDTRMDQEQKEIKEKILQPDKIAFLQGERGFRDIRGTVIGGLIVGTPFGKDLKITQFIGSHDPYTISVSRYIQHVKNRLKSNIKFGDRSQSLGKDLISSSQENNRTFEGNMRHAYPWLRKTEMQRFASAVSALDKLKHKTDL